MASPDVAGPSNLLKVKISLAHFAISPKNFALDIGESTYLRTSDGRNVRALIFYDQIASALKTNNFLRFAGHNGEANRDWEINLWHTGLLRFPSVADEALKLGADADVIVFAGCRAKLLRPWTIQWLERWASTHLTGHPVLALMEICPRMDEIELSEFARRYNFSFVAYGNVFDETNSLDDFKELRHFVFSVGAWRRMAQQVEKEVQRLSQAQKSKKAIARPLLPNRLFAPL